jgi:serine/threonine protein kinase/Flp pilus assembly protein TadD
MKDSASIEETIFNAARQLAEAQNRAAYLDLACGEDRALRERIERLLKAADQADQFLANNPLDLEKSGARTVQEAASTEGPGTVIDKYKLLEKLGEGGFGVVYMAEQRQPVKRRVALKIIKVGMDTREVVARFEAERQALAMMDHPNIAKVFDGGMTCFPLAGSAGILPASREVEEPAGKMPALPVPAGRPYFVMELVRGIKITDHCDEKSLSTGERLDLFIKVCQAVQHAHQKGIIHRDLKPSNILVTVNDGVAVPKIIDFGIAKATQAELTEKTFFTRFHQFLGTPAYMSPEQAELTSLDIDTRSDIYSLGVLLYELLTGKTPFETSELLKVGLDEMRRIIREKEPPRPSARLSTMVKEELSTTAQRRRASPPELVDLLRGDLDWIVMKCLEKDRARRYETANGLAMDIQRHRNNEPVLARPPSKVYRFEKLVRRNKLAFAAAAAVTIALVIGVTVSTWQASRARRAEQEAKTERDASRAVLNFFQDKVLAAGRPEGEEGGLGRDVSLRQAIDAAESQISEAFKDQPLVEAAIRETLGASYQYLGDYVSAVRQYERAVGLCRESLGPEHLGTIRSMNGLALAYGAAGDHDRALPLLERSFEVTKEALGPEHPFTARVMSNLALGYSEVGKLDQALRLYKEALRLERTRLGPGHPDTIHIMSNLAVAYQQAGMQDEALALIEESYEVAQATLGSEHPDTLNTMHCLAGAYMGAGKLDQAVPLYEKTLQLRKVKLGPDHPWTLISMNSLGVALQAAGKLDQALPLFEESIRLHTAKLGPEHPDTLAMVANLPSAYEAAGKLDVALAHFEETFRRQRSTLGSGHPATLLSMRTLARKYQTAGKFDQAVQLLDEALTLTRSKFGPEHLDTLVAMNNLGFAYLNQRKLDQAKPLLEEAFGLLKTKLGLDNQNTMACLRNLTSALWQQRRYAEVEQLLGEALPQAGEGQAASTAVLRIRGEFRARRGQWEEAASDFVEAIQQQPGDHELYHFLTAALVQIGDLEAYRRNCRQIMTRFAGATHPNIAERMAKDCLILASAGVDFATVGQLADTAVAAGETNPYYGWFLFVKGLADYYPNPAVETRPSLQAVGEAANPTAPQFIFSVTSADFVTTCNQSDTLGFEGFNCRI